MMREKQEERDNLIKKLVDAFDHKRLTQEISVIVNDEVKNIIDLYEKEHIIKKLHELQNKDKSNSNFAFIEIVADALLSRKNLSEFHSKRQSG